MAMLKVNPDDLLRFNNAEGKATWLPVPVIVSIERLFASCVRDGLTLTICPVTNHEGHPVGFQAHVNWGVTGPLGHDPLQALLNLIRKMEAENCLSAKGGK